MRERVTFVHPPDAGADQGLPEVRDMGFQGPPMLTTREDRLTFTLDELDEAQSRQLRAFDHLSIRWASPSTYETLEPYASRLSPGLHLSFGSSSQNDSDIHYICSWLRSFGLSECPQSYNGLVKLNSSSAANASAWYYFHILEDLQTFIKSAQEVLCNEADPICEARLHALSTAVALDVSFDAASEKLVVGALTPLTEQVVLVPASSQRRVEVGIFTRGDPPSLKPHHLGVSGVLAVLGEHKTPSPTLFSYPARHRLSSSSFSSKFLQPTGTHPTLQLTLNDNRPPNDEATCRPYAHLTLPKSLFADRYQLVDDLFLASKNLTAAKYISSPVDLEAPSYTTEIWGSTVLLEMAPPDAGESVGWTVEVPLHLRYLEPTASGYADVEVPYPAVFWACADEDGTDFSKSPFDRVHIGYDGLFDANTVFWHATPSPETGSRLLNKISVPVLKEDATSWVRQGTPIVILLGFLWVLWRLVSAYMRTGYGGAPSSVEDNKKKQ
ncbi:protein PBN1 [Stachybotrys elegans]|uniref:Protein PBN1 n=1 Tax=Stachybotrys elegans TaxID=80388 RepID=A0A8K0SND7_9HYPO|nr:protein PBN1 [Stachybotrys elegans]